MAPYLDREASPMSMSSLPTSPSTLPQAAVADPSNSSPTSKKRKRDTKPIPEIEVDVEAPEPPSKKALRKAKKGKIPSKQPVPKFVDTDHHSDSEGAEIAVQHPLTEKSKYGIWIGNLPWTGTKSDLENFLTSNGKIEKESITRIHMPVPAKTAIMASKQKMKPQNKGFAYVDFVTEDDLTKALALSETLLAGRRVLIKDAKSFEGRPGPVKEAEGAKAGLSGEVPPSKRIFVGNLAFDTTREELQEHFARCGEVADVFIATFEDTGKCKGYGWVTFEELDSAEKAVRGWVEIDAGEESGDEEKGDQADTVVKKKTRRKWWVNRIKGRALRMEFAEDKATRYKKRFGKGGKVGKENAVDEETPVERLLSEKNNVLSSLPEEKSRRVKAVLEGRKGKHVGERTIKAAAPLTGVERLTGAIVQSRGKKITFE